MTRRSARLRSRGAAALSMSLLAGTVVLTSTVAGAPAMAAPAPAPAPAPTPAPTPAPASTTANPVPVTAAYLESGYPGYFSSLHIVEDTLPATADHFTVEADFCVHPDAEVGDSVGFDLLWDAPISDWDELAEQPQRFTSTVPVVDSSGATLVNAAMVHDIGALSEDETGFLELKTTIDLELESGAVNEGGCGTLTLPIPAPLFFADGNLEPEEPLPGEESPHQYMVEFIDPEGVHSSDTLTLTPSDFVRGEAWTDGVVDFTGSAQWALVTPNGPSSETSVTLTGAHVCDEPFETAILDSTTMNPTNLEPDVQVECNDDVKTFTLENRLRADRQWVVVQNDPRKGTVENPATISAEFVLDGQSTQDTSSVAAASSSGRMQGAWVAPKGCPADSFTDVTSRTTFRDAIRWMQCRGITEGYADQTFRPARNISRGESIAILYRHAVTPALLEEREFWTDPGFPDVPEDSPFYDAVLWASNYGVTAGRADGTFGLNRPITRGEYAAFLYRTATTNPRVDLGESNEGSGFDDVPAGHTFEAEIAWLEQTGLVTGYADGTFRPGRQITRSEAAGLLYRYHVSFVRRG